MWEVRVDLPAEGKHGNQNWSFFSFLEAELSVDFIAQNLI